MQCVLLAAGYATRLYPLTENMPKALFWKWLRIKLTRLATSKISTL